MHEDHTWVGKEIENDGESNHERLYYLYNTGRYRLNYQWSIYTENSWTYTDDDGFST